jgi:hypothetical protein
MSSDKKDASFEYDVALSFAGEQREYVEELAELLRGFGIRVFYDDYETSVLWGKDLYEHLDYIYQRAAEYCIQFVSEDYARKVWTNHERKSAQARAIDNAGEYILPVRFDGTEIPGLRSTVGYIDATKVTPADLADLVKEKMGPRVRKNYFPPVPDLLYDRLLADTPEKRKAVLQIARSFMGSLQRMTKPERALLASIFTSGCPTEMPENIHIELDLIKRDLGYSPAEASEILKGMRSLGIKHEIRFDHEDHSEHIVVVRWRDKKVREPESMVRTYANEHSTEIAVAMLRVGVKHLCRECAIKCFEELDFSKLASSG